MIDLKEKSLHYQRGGLGRLFSPKLEHGNDLLQEIKPLYKDTSLKSVYLCMIGSLESRTRVIGSQQCILPPQLIELGVADSREIVALDTVIFD